MAREFFTPGVYIEEITKLPPSIASVETAIPAFIGYTEKAWLKEADDLHLKPRRISSLLEYEQFFGAARQETGIEVTVTTSSGKTDVVGKLPPKNASVYNMYYSLQLFFINGGGDCYIVSVNKMDDSNTIKAPDLKAGLEEVAKVDEVTLIVIPEALNMAIKEDYYALQNLALAQAADLQDRFVVMDVWVDRLNPKDPAFDEVQVFRDTISSDPGVLKYGASYYPRVLTLLDYQYNDDSKVTVNGVDGVKNLAELKSKNNALYFSAKTAITAITVPLPASVGVVGKYADTDAKRGVWKSPANVGLNFVQEPEKVITTHQQDKLNVDTNAGKSINVIRSFPGRGPAIIWGARTLTGNDNEWRYISVRRFFNMVEESTQNAAMAFVFEPNDKNTWVLVKSMIENYLSQQWNAGALMGATTKEAYFVHVGLNETMSMLDVVEGRMIVEIGLAVVRPAEFLILRFSHKIGLQS